VTGAGPAAHALRCPSQESLITSAARTLTAGQFGRIQQTPTGLRRDNRPNQVPRRSRVRRERPGITAAPLSARSLPRL